MRSEVRRKMLSCWEFDHLSSLRAVHLLNGRFVNKQCQFGERIVKFFSTRNTFYSTDAFASAEATALKHKITLLLALLFFAAPAAGQQQQAYTVAGRVIDAADGSALPGLTTVIRLEADTTQFVAGVSNAEGEFILQVARQGSYRLRLSFVGYEPHVQSVYVDSTYNSIGTIPLRQAILGMDEVMVEDVQERFRIEGDTTIFNADAFKVNPDASAEDLVAKLPGVVMRDGQVEAQGEQVQRVLVDGREFFGDDPNVALRNLPAEVIQSIEIFEQESDQAQFTGFSDGEAQQTINIVTRTGMNNGQFGKVYGGYGEDARYASGGNANIFDDDRRISIIGLSNNVNQQNFAFEDLLGISGSDDRRGPPRGVRGGGGPPRGSRGGGRRGRGGNGFNPRDFLVGQQGGLNNTTSLGFNYSDEIGSRLKLSSSYFFNRMGNTNDAFLDRQLFLPDEQSQFYNESTFSTSTNLNHRINARIEYTFNENNSLLIRPRLSFQDNDASNRLAGSNVLNTGALLNEALNNSTSNNSGYTSSTRVLYRHRFPKRGRTLSTEFEMGLNDRWGDTDQFSTTEFFEQDLVSADSTYDQQIDSESASSSFGIDIDFTEPLGEDGRLRFSYEPSYGKNVSDRFAYVLDLQTGLYTILDPTFSSLFDNDVFRHIGGVTFQQDIGERFELQLGIEAQSERLLGDQTYPVAFDLDRSFFSILPEIELEYEIDGELDLDLDYRTSTNTPSVSQLQDVIDNANPLFLSTGNPELEPSYRHTIRLRARRGNWREGRTVFGYVNLDYERNSIGTASLLAVQDTVLTRGVVLQQGSQFSYPVNMNDPSINVRSFFGFGTPFPLLKSNLNFRGGVTYARTPGLINNTVNMATLYAINGGLTIASNISERLDFTVSYGADYNIASNSFYQQLDENYFRHDAGLRFTWLSVGGLIVESSLRFNDYLGLEEELYPTTFIMNAGLGYKFMRQDVAELKLVVGDIFNQETGISRSITELYVEDSRTQVLGRYILLNFSYRFRNFGI